MEKAIATVQIDDDRTRVTEWDFPPGSETGFHVHEMDYVVVPTVGGTLTITDDSGKEMANTITPGQSYGRKAGVAHNVENRSDSRVVFVEVELKP